MSKGKSYHVVPRDNGWGVKAERAARSSAIRRTKAKAIETARDLAKKQGGQVKIHGQNGEIQEERTYRKDPYPPKG
jgi:hypothetical protein